VLIFGLDGLDRIGQIADIITLEAVERDLRPGSWRLTVPAGEIGSVARSLLAVAHPGVELWDPDTGWRYGGFVTHRETEVTPTATTVTFAGLDFQAILARRLDRPHPDLADWDEPVTPLSTSLSTMAVRMIHRNVGPGDAAAGATAAAAYRRIPDLEVIYQPGIGSVVNYEPSGRPLIELLQDWFTGFTHTAELRLVRDADGEPALRFTTPARPKAERLVLSPGMGTMASYRIVETAAAVTEIAVLTGFENVSGWRDTRWGITFGPGGVELGATSGTPADWRWNLVEGFFPQAGLGSDGDTDPVDQEITDLATDNDHTRSVAFEGLEVTGYGRDIGVGWLVDAALDDTLDSSGEGSYTELPVVASTLTFTPDTGWRREVDVGAEALDRGPAAIYTQLSRLIRRIRALERNA
jgi:hypothetical protein